VIAPVVDYLVARHGMPAPSGGAYDYVLAGDGLFLCASNVDLDVRIPVASCAVRGLPPLYPACTLKQGRVPQSIWDELLHYLRMAHIARCEMLVGVRYEVAEYRLIVPPQAVGPRTLEQRTGCSRWADGPSTILWLDSGNGRDDGQVLLGNAVTIAQLRRSFHEDTRLCTGLPAPGLQRPDLLSAPPSPAFARNPSCAQQVEDGEQGRTINQLMAGLVAAYVERLLDGTCCWMATYLDLTDGLLRCMPAEPRAVSACTRVPIVSLIDRRGHASVAS
jgi:hypothetical protein